MFILKKAGCRIFQTGFRIASPLLPYREPKILDSCAKLDIIFKKENKKSVLIVTDKGIASSGLCDAVIMPYVLKAYGKSIYKKLYQLVLFVGVATENDTQKEGADKFIKAVEDLNKKMQIPDKLSGISPDDIPLMAHHAEKEANPLYPVPVLMTKKELEKFYYEIGGLHAKN